jgi:ABC-type phosphate/phosphonate transport system substrate-binding protein
VTQRYMRQPSANPPPAPFAWWWAMGRLSVLMVVLCLVPLGARGESQFQFRIGFSKFILGEVNENDAMAVVSVWARQIAQASDIAVDPQPLIFRNIAEIQAALTDKTVDCINLTTAEYFAVQGQIAKDMIVVSVISDSINEEYVLLVHRESGIESLGDLKGRSLGMLRSARTSLAPVWLDTLLVREGFSPASDLFKEIIPATKIGKAVLPVFFRKMDACVVTRAGFRTMIELNPQTGRQLRVLATSPSLVPVLFCFRSDYSSPLRGKIIDEITNCHLSPACRQIMTLFQTDSLKEIPGNSLASALNLLEQHAQLSGELEIGPKGKVSGQATRGVQ